MTAQINGRTGLVIAVFAALALAHAACSPSHDNPDVVSAAWACPEHWVPYAAGGCGPAVALCAADGGAAPDACNGMAISTPMTIDEPDGGAGATLYRLADGGLAGAWIEPGSPSGPPLPAWVPDLGEPDGGGACPAGWVHRDDGTCDPALRTDCPAGSGPLPGSQCTATAASDCPPGAYADLGPEAMGATVLHVRMGADATTADGSEAHPFATIGAARSVAAAGAWISVTDGAYDETLEIQSDVHVVGRCAARVAIAPTSASGPTAIVRADASAAHLDLRGVTVRGPLVGIAASSGAHVTLRGVVIDHARGCALAVDQDRTTVDSTDLWIVDTQVDGPSPTLEGRGAQISNGAQWTGSRVSISGSHESSIYVHFGMAAVTLTDAVVANTNLSAAMNYGDGIWVETTARFTGTRLVVAGSHHAGMIALGTGTVLTLTDAVVRDTQTAEPDQQAFGIGVAAGAGGTLRRVQIERAAQYLLFVGGGAVVTAEDSRFSGAPDVPYASGMGIVVADSALSLSRVRVAGVGNSALVTSGSDSVVTVTDTVISGVRSAVSRGMGTGIEVQSGSSVSAARVTIDHVEGMGVFAVDDMTHLQFADSAVIDTVASQHIGRGMNAQDGARIDAMRVVLDGNAGAGAMSDRSGELWIRDSVVRASHGIAEGVFGFGLAAQNQGHLQASRVLVRDCVEVGLLSAGAGSQIDLDDVIVQHISPSLRGFGVGVGAFAGGGASAQRLAVIDTSGGAVVAIDGPDAIGQNATGSSIQVSDLFVRSVLSSGLRYLPGSVGPAVAYGLHTGLDCHAVVTRAVFDGGGYGFANSRGVIELHDALVTHQLDAAGARAGMADVITLDHVALNGNRSNDVLTTSDLPEGSALELPSAVCPAGGCM